nr:hypothetical protein [Tanacetum cinerariifolium]
LQKLISQLEILRESLSQEDINLKFLRSLPTEWRTHTLIWRNKIDLEEQSLDDLFNSLKIYEAEVKSSSPAISVVASVSAATAKIPIFALLNVDTLSNADAKTLMEVIEKRFGGNKETKKVQKTLLKQQYENFTGLTSESLDQIHDRLQKLISQLEILRESLSQEDINLKFLRSLPTEWRTHTLIWRNSSKGNRLNNTFNNPCRSKRIIIENYFPE